MRENVTNGISVSYPDKVVAVFASNPVTIKGFTGTHVELVINGVRDKRSPFGDECFFDLSYYMQTMFGEPSVSYDDVSDSGMAKPFSVTLSFYNDTTLIGSMSFDLLGVWAVSVYNGNESLKMFKGYPFTVGVLSDGTSTATIGTKVYSLTKAAMYNIPMTEGEVNVKDASGSVRTIEVTEGCGDGIYLRWVDSHGVWRYWLFKRGAMTTKVSNETFNRRAKRYLNKAVGDSVEICAPMVDAATFGFLKGCVESPVVYMYDNGAWTGVYVEGDIVQEREAYQDFIATLVLPEREVQKL